MTKKQLNRALKLTQECLERYWQLDAEYVLSFCDEDVIWIGSVQRQFMEGFEKSAADLRGSIAELRPCHLLQQEFFVAQNFGNACTIVGKYLTTTDDEVEYFLQVQQRCTFTWELSDGELRIKHMHVSNPMGELSLAPDEIFPDSAGKMAKKYLLNYLNALSDNRRLVVTDREERTHFLALSEVVYAAADGRNSLIYTMSGEEICARANISEILAAGEGRLISAHRSYVINVDYISSIRRYEATMVDGSRIPIPAKKYKSLREALSRQYGEIQK